MRELDLDTALVHKAALNNKYRKMELILTSFSNLANLTWIFNHMFYSDYFGISLENDYNSVHFGH